jgi:hypothetical protein
MEKRAMFQMDAAESGRRAKPRRYISPTLERGNENKLKTRKLDSPRVFDFYSLLPIYYRFQLSDEILNLVGNDFPDNSEINPKVIMNNSVSETAYPIPIDFRMLFCLSRTLQTASIWYIQVSFLKIPEYPRAAIPEYV